MSRVDPYWIVLDLGRDRYFSLQHRDLALIGDLIFGWSDERSRHTEHPGAVDERQRVCCSLESAGIFTRNPERGKAFAEIHVPLPVDSLCRQHGLATSSIVDRIRFLASCAKVDWGLRTGNVQRTMLRTGLARWRPRRNPVAAGPVVDMFDRLRPLYPRNRRCLFDSLALRRFLAAHGLTARLIVGVVADPFHAHCWLQQGDLLLNDDLERVRRFKPILCA